MTFEPDTPIPAPVTPPKSWFTSTPDWFDPQGSLIQIDFETGRVAALVAPYTECILDGTGNCWTPPPSQTNYEYAHVGTMLTEEGEQVRVANIGGGIDHANLYAQASVAADHYANTATRKMVGRYVDEPGVGILFLGSLWPGQTFGDTVEVMASALSGDWRYIKSLNDYEMCGSQLVNNPGFRPVPARAASFGVARYACMGEDAEKQQVMLSHWDTHQKGGEGSLEERLERLEKALITLLLIAQKDTPMVAPDFVMPEDGWEDDPDFKIPTITPALPYRAGASRKARKTIKRMGVPGGGWRWDNRDPNTGKFAPLGYVSPRVLSKLNSDDPNERRHALLVLKSKFDSPRAKPLVVEFAVKRAKGEDATDLARQARDAIIGPRPKGKSKADRRKQSAWDKAANEIAAGLWTAVDKIEDVEDYEDYIDNAGPGEGGGGQVPGETTEEEIVEAITEETGKAPKAVVGDDEDEDVDTPDADEPDEPDTPEGDDEPEADGGDEDTSLEEVTPVEVREAAEESNEPIEALVADDRLSPVGINKGDVVEVTDSDGAYGIVTSPNGQRYNVSWERFEAIDRKDKDRDEEVPEDTPDVDAEAQIPEVPESEWRKQKKPFVTKVNDGEATAEDFKSLAGILDAEADYYEARGDTETSEARRKSAKGLRDAASVKLGEPIPEKPDEQDASPEPPPKFDFPFDTEIPVWAPYAGVTGKDTGYTKDDQPVLRIPSTVDDGNEALVVTQDGEVLGRIRQGEFEPIKSVTKSGKSARYTKLKKGEEPDYFDELPDWVPSDVEPLDTNIRVGGKSVPAARAVEAQVGDNFIAGDGNERTIARIVPRVGGGLVIFPLNSNGKEGSPVYLDAAALLALKRDGEWLRDWEPPVDTEDVAPDEAPAEAPAEAAAPAV